MPSKNAAKYALFVLAVLSAVYSVTVPKAHAPISPPPPGYVYTLNTYPPYSQEGATIALILTVTIPPPTAATFFQFRFNVTDPAGNKHLSQLVNATASPGQTELTKTIAYPGQYFATAINDLVGHYSVSAEQLLPFVQNPAALSSFTIGITNSASYERTQTVNIQATGYNASENVGVTIKTQTTSTIVYSQTMPATSGGIVSTSWGTLPNTTIDGYIVTLTGSSTRKTPPDTQIFYVRAATMIIAVISSSKSTYQRTETMRFAFQPTYPDGSISTGGVGFLLLTGPSGKGVTLSTTYDSIAKTFNETYQTTTVNQTGTWTLTIGTPGYSFSDQYGNTGPAQVVTNRPQLTPATIAITVSTNTNIAVGQQLRFNVTGTYPDGSPAQSGTVRAYLIYSGTPAINYTVPIVYDSGLGGWIGTYTARQGDTGGLWSMDVSMSDGSTPANFGTATRAITIQNNASNTSPSFPLYWFAVIAAIISGILIATVLVFKRRRIGHASLKIDLEAVHSEAGRIESGEFFKTIKEQVQKDQEDKP